MYTLNQPNPRRGLSVPMITACDGDGRVQEAQQRRLVRFLVNDGWGADIVFCNGTTGEWNRLSPEERDRVIAISCEALAEENARLTGHRPVELWAGITGHTVAESLGHLRTALAHGADGVVLAPLSIQDHPGVLPLFHGPITDCMDEAGRHVPLLLYDNAAIAADAAASHLRTRDVKQLSRLDYVRGIKVSAPPRVLGNYTRGALHFNERHAFGIYVGNAFQIFDLFAPRQGLLGKLQEYWQRYWLHASLPVGVVSGHANVFPREWQRAWLACERGEAERMDRLGQALQGLRSATRFTASGRTEKRSIACLKRALLLEGVLSDATVAPGTPTLSAEQTAAFDAHYAKVRAEVQAAVAPRWCSRWEEACGM